MARLLDRALCEVLEQRWRDQGAEIVHVLRPGLTDVEIDRLTAEVAISLPEEARVWWRWHDGAGEPGGVWQPEVALGPGISFDPLQDAVGRCRMWRMMHEDIDPSGWSPTLLPISGLDDTAILIDCGVAPEDPVPVQGYIAEGGTGGGPDVLSMGDLVEIWIRAIDCGGWWYDRTTKRWDSDWERLPADLQIPGITG